MKDETLKKLVDLFCEGFTDVRRKELEDAGVLSQIEDMLKNQFSDYSDEDSIYIMKKMMSGASQIQEGYRFDDIDEEKLEAFSDRKNYTISFKDDKKRHCLRELLKKCSVEQLNLYYRFYHYIYQVYDFEENLDKKSLIDSLEKDILIAFKNYIKTAKTSEIPLLKKALKTNGFVSKVEEDEFINSATFIPFRNGKHKVRYVMPSELLDIVQNHDFHVLTSENKELVSQLLDYFVLSKGVVSKSEIKGFIFKEAFINITEKELFRIVRERFDERKNYFYEKEVVDKKLFDELVEIKKECPYMPTYEEIIDLKIFVEELYMFLVSHTNEEVKLGKILKTLFYDVKEVSVLVDEVSRVFKISKKDRDELEEILMTYHECFLYWLYNGEPGYSWDQFVEAFEELVSSYEDFDEEDCPF